MAEAAEGPKLGQGGLYFSVTTVGVVLTSRSPVWDSDVSARRPSAALHSSPRPDHALVRADPTAAHGASSRGWPPTVRPQRSTTARLAHSALPPTSSPPLDRRPATTQASAIPFVSLPYLDSPNRSALCQRVRSRNIVRVYVTHSMTLSLRCNPAYLIPCGPPDGPHALQLAQLGACGRIRRKSHLRLFPCSHARATSPHPRLNPAAPELKPPHTVSPAHATSSPERLRT
ncbi:hypothetical protein BC628DRAFT_1182537 [Trametes gibbosa]|nr:hypothetical protein BC628DRAFT_1182537 [Trametes gibbosa]